MQALVVVLASLIVAFAALSLASNYELFAQQQQTCKDRNTGDYLTSFSCGNVRVLENGTTVRNYTLLAEEIHQIPITMNDNSMEQTIFPAWTYNGSVPGPTLRMNEGDLVHITVINSPQSEVHHSLHMHSIHEPVMDGTFGSSADIAPGESFTYKFTAGPAGLYPYHCHVEPVQDHINRGLYGAMIIDPKAPREPANEMMMLMNSYDLDLNEEMAPTVRPPDADEGRQILYPPVQEEDGEGNGDAAKEEEGEEDTDRPELELERDNEFYTVNGKAFEYMQEPIKIKLGEPVRLYLLNMIEFDPVNNFHLHSGMFNYTASGTEGTPPMVTDIVTLSQGDRGLIEFTPTNKGMMMIHSHINEFSQLGWMGAFEVV